MVVAQGDIDAHGQAYPLNHLHPFRYELLVDFPGHFRIRRPPSGKGRAFAQPILLNERQEESCPKKVDIFRTFCKSFDQGPWGQRYQTIAAAWRWPWDCVIPFFAFPPAIRRIIYTTNAIESLNAQLRKIIKTRGYFPSDEAAATKLLWLALRNITSDWERPALEWKAAMNQFAIIYADRFTHPHR